jgi:hypothetical protein
MTSLRLLLLGILLVVHNVWQWMWLVCWVFNLSFRLKQRAKHWHLLGWIDSGVLFLSGLLLFILLVVHRCLHRSLWMWLVCSIIDLPQWLKQWSILQHLLFGMDFRL